MIHQKYLELLQPWTKAAERHLYRFPDRPELICYGSGTNTWGVQTNQKALAAFAVLAVEPELDEKEAGMTREEILAYALAMLRFSLQSHIEGNYTCTDGTPWGHTWISVLGIERMMHGVEAIREHLTVEDKALLRKVLVSESDWLMDNYPIVAGPVDNNKPESNLWNGAILHRTAALYPDLPRVNEYQEKGSKFLVNAISIPADAQSSVVVDGKNVSDWFVGNNYFSSYALNHHHYLNVGYMVICLSNAAMLHFMYREKEIDPPEALYHHIDELWKLVKTCIFPDGRLLRIGGDTRIRYCYCQDYIIPSLLMMEDAYGDLDCQNLERGWLDLVKQEQKYNEDGSFFSKRGEKLEKISPLYYTRLESDRAATLSMGLYWRRIINHKGNTHATKNEQKKIHSFQFWKDDYHGACLHRSDNRVASWVWEAAEKPQGLCLSPKRSDMAEWHTNLAGQIKGMGFSNNNRIESHREISFEGGFLTYGRVVVRSEKFVAEGESDRDIASEKIVFSALPDDATVLIMQHANAIHRDYFSTIKGLLLQIPNDLFNGNERMYFTEKGRMDLQGYGSVEEQMDIEGSWMNVDDCLTIMKSYGQDSISLYRPGTRQIQIVNRFPDTGNLYADEICCACRVDAHSVNKGDSLFNIGFILRSGESHEDAENYSKTQKDLTVSVEGCLGVKAILCQGVDQKKYLLVADMGLDSNGVEEEVLLKLPKEFTKITDIYKGSTYLYNNSSAGFLYVIEKDQAALFIVE